MNNLKQRCPNMNHGKPNPSIAFCPNCGERFVGGPAVSRQCSDDSHRMKRRDRCHFCLDCGKDLSK